MWTHERYEPESDQESAIVYETLTVGDWTELQIIHVEDGYFVQAADGCNAEIEIGTADDLDTAKKLAERWALAQIAEMLSDLGAEGIWLVRGARTASLTCFRPEPGAHSDTFWIHPEPPMARLMLIRFPAGDGGEGGIEYYG